jgi:transcriptional regulator with XRE-family HTH domain
MATKEQPATDGKDELATRIGAAVRERRKTAQLTLTQVSQLAGMSVSHLSSVENGLTLMSLPMLAKLAAALGTSLADLTRDDSFVFEGASIPAAPGSTRLSHPSLVLESQGLFLTAGKRAVLDTAGARDLFVYVIDGTVAIGIDKERVSLGPGDALDARAPSVTTFQAESDARLLWATAPSVHLG